MAGTQSSKTKRNKKTHQPKRTEMKRGGGTKRNTAARRNKVHVRSDHAQRHPEPREHERPDEEKAELLSAARRRWIPRAATPQPSRPRAHPRARENEMRGEGTRKDERSGARVRHVHVDVRERAKEKGREKGRGGHAMHAARIRSPGGLGRALAPPPRAPLAPPALAPVAPLVVRSARL